MPEVLNSAQDGEGSELPLHDLSYLMFQRSAYLMNDTLEDTKLDEKILEDDVNCELKPSDHRPIPCSVTAAFIYRSCWSNGDIKVCEDFGYAIEEAKLQGFHCTSCHGVCWTVRPI